MFPDSRQCCQVASCIVYLQVRPDIDRIIGLNFGRHSTIMYDVVFLGDSSLYFFRSASHLTLIAFTVILPRQTGHCRHLICTYNRTLTSEDGFPQSYPVYPALRHSIIWAHTRDAYHPSTRCEYPCLGQRAKDTCQFPCLPTLRYTLCEPSSDTRILLSSAFKSSTHPRSRPVLG
jgi:hypothetical protein